MPNLRAIVSLKCLFPMSGVLGQFSAAKKNLFLCNFHGPCFTLSFFFFQQHTSAVKFPPLFGMREFGGGMGGVSFSRVYQAPESGSISDFTQGKSETSAAVDSGEVQSAHQFLLDSLHLPLSVLNVGFRVKPGRGCVARGLDGSGYCSPYDLHLIGVGGNVLAKLRWGSTPVFCQEKLDWTLITTP